MAESDEVVLWKAPQPGRNAVREVLDGFDPAEYPGDGPFFAADRDLAEQFQQLYRNGLQEFHLPATEFYDLVRRGIVRPDRLFTYGIAWHVPDVGLAEFNELIQQAANGIYRPES